MNITKLTFANCIMEDVESGSKTIDKIHSRLRFHEAEEKTPTADIIFC